MKNLNEDNHNKIARVFENKLVKFRFAKKFKKKILEEYF